MKGFIVALAFGVALPVSAFAQDAPPFLKNDRASSGRQFRLAGMDGGLRSERRAGREDQGIDRPRRRRSNSLPILRLRLPHGGGEEHAGATDEQIKEAVAASRAGAKNEHGIKWQSVRHDGI